MIRKTKKIPWKQDVVGSEWSAPIATKVSKPKKGELRVGNILEGPAGTVPVQAPGADSSAANPLGGLTSPIVTGSHGGGVSGGPSNPKDYRWGEFGGNQVIVDGGTPSANPNSKGGSPGIPSARPVDIVVYGPFGNPPKEHTWHGPLVVDGGDRLTSVNPNSSGAKAGVPSAVPDPRDSFRIMNVKNWETAPTPAATVSPFQSANLAQKITGPNVFGMNIIPKGWIF